MEILTGSKVVPPSSSPLSIFSPKRSSFSRPLSLPLASSHNEKKEGDVESDSRDSSVAPVRKDRSLSISPLSKETAMGLVLNAAVGRGWTTGSGMEGPPVPVETESCSENTSTFPFSLFTKSPRRRMLVAFTCNICKQRTTRAINPHAYTDGTVFVQCCGCNAYHKLVDNLNLFHDMNCYVNSSFNYSGPNLDVNFNFLDSGDAEDDLFSP
ncbi:uncharacterized protein LOC115735606 [Rhodamnia argentea]|uniref:Uncharacterized protein LOC115735606 n=1 Tax=Rhodamnia argentea TaxID=178133 RepID=A0A8B8NJZ0_9MYRT|nr:uncharacterized protein LOC115735606 [Rhodamnia argentea]